MNVIAYNSYITMDTQYDPIELPRDADHPGHEIDPVIEIIEDMEGLDLPDEEMPELVDPSDDEYDPYIGIIQNVTDLDLADEDMPDLVDSSDDEISTLELESPATSVTITGDFPTYWHTNMGASNISLIPCQSVLFADDISSVKVEESIARLIGSKVNLVGLNIIIETGVDNYGLILLEEAISSQVMYNCDSQERMIELCIQQIDFVERLVASGVKLPPEATLTHKLVSDRKMSGDRKCFLIRALVSAGQDLTLRDKVMGTLPDVTSHYLSGTPSYSQVTRCLIQEGMPWDVITQNGHLDSVVQEFYQYHIENSDILCVMIQKFPVKVHLESWDRRWHENFFFGLNILLSLVLAGSSCKNILSSLMRISISENKMLGYLLITNAAPYFIYNSKTFTCARFYVDNEYTRYDDVYTQYLEDRQTPPSLMTLSAHSVRSRMSGKVPGCSVLPLFPEFLRKLDPLPSRMREQITLECYHSNQTEEEETLASDLPWQQYKTSYLLDDYERLNFTEQPSESDNYIS